MMEVQVEVSFSSPEKDTDFWEQLLTGLCAHKRGAWLEEQFDRFGKEAATAITDIMNECEHGNGTVVFEGWERDGDRFETCIEGGWIIFDLAPKIRDLLGCCNVQELYMDDPEENEC